MTTGRKTVRRRILARLQEETHGFSDASIIARYGEDLVSTAKQLLSAFYTLRRLDMSNELIESIPVSEQAGWHKRLETLRRQTKQIERSLCDLFMRAVITHDGEAIRELGDAVVFLKGKQQPVDTLRHSLLGLKGIAKLIWKRNSVTIREIVQHLEKDGVQVGSPEDGYSKIRRVCKELEIQIKPTRKTRRK